MATVSKVYNEQTLVWNDECCEIDDETLSEASPNMPHASHSFDNILADNKGHVKGDDFSSDEDDQDSFVI